MTDSCSAVKKNALRPSGQFKEEFLNQCLSDFSGI
jgi:hypothetical protein